MPRMDWILSFLRATLNDSGPEYETQGMLLLSWQPSQSWNYGLAVWIIAVIQEVDYTPAVWNILWLNRHNVKVVIMALFWSCSSLLFMSKPFGFSKSVWALSCFFFILSLNHFLSTFRHLCRSHMDFTHECLCAFLCLYVCVCLMGRHLPACNSGIRVTVSFWEDVSQWLTGSALF